MRIPRYTVLHCTVLYDIVLYCTILYCIVLYCAVLRCAILQSPILIRTILYCTVRVVRGENCIPPPFCRSNDKEFCVQEPLAAQLVSHFVRKFSTLLASHLIRLLCAWPCAQNALSTDQAPYGVVVRAEEVILSP